MEAKFTVIYGANNLGKSEQVFRLTQNLVRRFIPVERIKYPIYDLEPTGRLINSVVREGIPMEPIKLQKLYAQNRRDFEPTIKGIISNGTHIVAEDYIGTGVAWGLTEGVSLEILEEINKDLLEPDICILLDGERFTSGIERGHRFEGGKWELAREKHLFLAERYGWEIVNANQSKEKVAEDIWKIVSS